MNQTPSRKKLLVVLLCFVFVFGLIILAINATRKNGNFELSVSPMKATIEFNGKSIKVDRTARFNLPVGKTQIKVSAENFIERTIEVNVEEINKNGLTQYGVLLDPANEDGEKILKKKSELEWRDYVGQLEALNNSIDLSRDNPLFTYLPKQSANYRVDYAIDPTIKDKLSYIVWITASSDAARNEALEWIKAVDSVGSYNIQYRTYADVPERAQSSPTWEPSGKDTSDPAIEGGRILN